MTFSIRTKMTVLCCLFLLVFIPSIIFLLRNLAGVVEDFKHVVYYTGEVIGKSHLLSKLVIDMETGQRGFIITGKEEFLEPYNIANAKFDKVLAELREAVSDRPKYLNALEKIEHLRYKWIGIAGEPEIEARRLVEKSRFDLKTINQIIMSQKGKHILDKIRVTIDAMSDDFRKAGKKDELIVITQIIKDVVDSETGERGFLLAGKDWFLEPYYRGQLNFSKHVEQLEKMLQADKESLERLADVRGLYGEWLVEAARPEIHVRVEYEKDPRDIDDVAKLLAAGTGKKIIDELREVMAEFTGDLTKEMKRKLSQSERSVALANILSLIISSTGILLSIGLAFLIGRSIVKPISVLRKGTEIIGNGDLSHRIGLKGRDELGVLADSFNKMTEDLNTSVDNLNREIADRKQAQEALAMSEERLKALIDNAPDGIYVIDPVMGRFIGGNRKTEELVGYPREELIGKNFVEAGILPEEYIPKAMEGLEKNKQGQPTGPDEYELLRKDGSRVFVEIMSFPVARKGKVEIIGIARDTSNRKLAEEEQRKLQAQLQRAQKMEVIGTLAGGVAHDLNNILSGLISYPELLLLEIPEDSPLRNPILTIQKSGEKAAAIVQDLLTLARRGVAVTEVVNLNLIISEYVKSPEHEKLISFHPGVQVRANLEADLLNILGSPAHLSKTVMNLVSNAAEAMTEGGEIPISTENRYIDRPIRGYDSIDEGDYVILTVSDTGVGILPTDMERIFEPFYTKKVMGRSGTGLGMAVVWGTVKDYKGYIDIQSAKGKGTTFTLYFPITRKELPKDKSLVSIEDYMGKGESILVVDDVKEQREIATKILKKLDYSVSTVSSGEEAVDYLKDNSVDLLILDMIMDPGIDGYETYKRIIEFHPGQKAIIASGFSETKRVKKAQKLGAGAYVKKPFLLGKIGVAVRDELDKELPF